LKKSFRSDIAKLLLKPTRLSPRMAIPLKAISIAFREGELIFEGLRELFLGRNETFCQGFCGATLKDQPAGMSGGILLRYRLSGNSHPGSAKI
jgi:hypothetical protein